MNWPWSKKVITSKIGIKPGDVFESAPGKCLMFLRISFAGPYEAICIDEKSSTSKMTYWHCELTQHKGIALSISEDVLCMMVRRGSQI